MNMKKWKVTFKDKTCVFIIHIINSKISLTEERAKILAQAEQIKKGQSFEIVDVIITEEPIDEYIIKGIGIVIGI